ncbi:cysteine proteinase [Cylindrobasidium torrendii FP15055 ss-10]|uniref:ubiquitinyl hydrolase 1 n=1 Tax=Cylindrobasidium torrendii FP15055 ss-10 TaxID=1314674 RepID=A0A0D7BNB7_9AGAR|nr:cysteine proteinase [Cylindrobasidium torrendii FP15055 ss-10]
MAAHYTPAGPSNYYNSRSSPVPPPQMMYGPNGAGPNAYQYAPYPHMPPQMHGGHPMPPPHMAGRGRGGHYNQHGRGGPHHYGSHPHAPPYSPVMAHSPVLHAAPISPHYPPPQFAAPYHYQSASPVPYPPPPPPQAWQPPPMSPLPKQLATHPPVQDVPTHPIVVSASPSLTTFPPVSIEQAPPAEAKPPSPATATTDLPPTPTSSSVHTVRPTSAASTASSYTSVPQPSALASSEWVIWSRRPDDPSNAPGIIFSPRCKPPDRIVREALQLPPPVEPPAAPPEPKPTPTVNSVESAADSNEAPAEYVQVDEAAVDVQTEPEAATEKAPSEDIQFESSSSSTVPTETPTVPGSPLSTNTSVSIAASAVQEAKQEPTPVAATPPAKKSWASLLRTTPSNTPAKNALPTSAVVGFSIPAVAPAPVSPSKKNDLISLLTTGNPALSAPAPSPSKLKPRGLINTGNMCFANSVLQILLYCPPFFRLFHELGRLVGTGERIMNDAPLTNATIEFLKNFYEADKPKENPTSPGRKGKDRATQEENDEFPESFIPTFIYDAMKEKKRFDSMRGGNQEDAEEFLGFYLDTLEEELLHMANVLDPVEETAPAVEEHEEDAPQADDGWLEVGKKNRTVITRTTKTTESPITKIFGGKARSTLRAPQQKDSVTIEDWRSLRLDIQPEHIHTIEDAMKHITDPQSIQMASSARPGTTVEASQQVLLDTLPSILTLHVKRFHFDTQVGDVVKVAKQVRFGPELEISNEIMAPSARKTQPARYKLFGALYHHGISASGGHYTLDVLHPARYGAREGWIRIDDELVSDVRPADVFDAWERDERTAYLLFYRRLR